MCCTMHLEHITPDCARELINESPCFHYGIDFRRVKQFAEIMQDGKWETQAPGVFIRQKDSAIIDGLHRLFAILVSGKAQDMFITYGNESRYSRFEKYKNEIEEANNVQSN